MKNNKNKNDNKKNQEPLNSNVNGEPEVSKTPDTLTDGKNLTAEETAHNEDSSGTSDALPLLSPKRVNGDDTKETSTIEEDAVTYSSNADKFSYNSTVSVDKLSLDVTADDEANTRADLETEVETEPELEAEAELQAETELEAVTDITTDPSLSEESYKEIILDSKQNKMPKNGFEIKPDFAAPKPSPFVEFQDEEDEEDEVLQPNFELVDEDSLEFSDTDDADKAVDSDESDAVTDSTDSTEHAETGASLDIQDSTVLAETPSEKPNYFANFRKNISREYQNIKANRQAKKSAEKAEEARNPRMRAMKQARHQRGGAGTLLLVSAFATLFIRLFWANQETEFLGVNRMNLDGAFFLELLIQLLAIVIPSLLIYLIYKLNPQAIIGRSKQNKTSYALSALTGLLLAVGAIGIHNLNVFALDKLNLNPSYTNLYNINEQPSIWGILLIVLVLAVVPALTEEFMFRGVIQSALTSSSKLHLSILLTATASALYEGNVSFILVPLVVGIYLSYAKANSDNLLISVVIHFFYKLSLIALQPVMPMFSSSIDLHGSDGQSAFYSSLVFAIVAIIVLFPLSKATFKSYSENAEKVEEAPSKRRRLSQEQWFPVDWKFLLALLIIFIGASVR